MMLLDLLRLPFFVVFILDSDGGGASFASAWKEMDLWRVARCSVVWDVMVEGWIDSLLARRWLTRLQDVNKDMITTSGSNSQRAV